MPLTKLLTLLGVLLLTAAACSSSGGDREAAIANLTAGEEPLTEEQANCVVDGVGEDDLAEFDNFSTDFQNDVESELSEPSAEIQELFDLLFQCALGDAGTEGVDAGAEGEIDCSTVDGPCDHGDDADLDALWDACESGDGEACDDLFFQSPVGSRYEQFGNTCGDRGLELSCAEAD